MKRGQGCEWLTSTVTVALDMEHYRALVVVAKEGSIGGPAEEWTDLEVGRTKRGPFWDAGGAARGRVGPDTFLCLIRLC
jgi:hypothetical protein